MNESSNDTRGRPTSELATIITKPITKPTTEPTRPIAVDGQRELRVVRASDGVSTIQLARSDGPIEVEIVIRPEGPVVRVHAAELELSTTGAMALACEDFSLRARGSIELRADGDLSQFIAGDLQSVAGGELRMDAKALRARARLGQVRIEASDNVRIEGERILLNG